jgi:hypothetical protein
VYLKGEKILVVPEDFFMFSILDNLMLEIRLYRVFVNFCHPSIFIRKWENFKPHLLMCKGSMHILTLDNLECMWVGLVGINGTNLNYQNKRLF